MYTAAYRLAVVAAFTIDCWTARGDEPGRADEAQTPKQTVVTIGKETTRITEPLRKDGFPNYAGALERQARQGATVDNNVAVVLFQVMGPSEISEEFRREYFQRLGIQPLPVEGDYLVPFYVYLDEVLGAGDERKEELDELFETALEAPWTKDQMPHAAQWLQKYEKQLDLIVRASKRPRYYSPLIGATDDDHPPMIIAVLLPATMQFRAVVRPLVARAMLRLGEGKIDDAWSDLIACHRLARLARQGPTLVDGLVGAAVESMAWRGVTAFAHHGDLNVVQVKKFRAELDALPPPVSFTDKLDASERYMFLDCVCTVARDGFKAFNELASLSVTTDEPAQKKMWEEFQNQITRRAVDWDEVLRMGNHYYDRLVAAARLKDCKIRAEKLKQFNDQLMRQLGALRKSRLGLPLMALGGERGKKLLSRTIGGLFASLLLPAMTTVINVENRDKTQLRMEHISLALAAYRDRHGQYPDQLDDLVPGELASLPVDEFTKSAIRYRRDGTDYALYSLGPNGNDDGGRQPGDDVDLDVDDVVVRTTPAN